MAYIEGKLAERGIKVVLEEMETMGLTLGINYDEKDAQLESQIHRLGQRDRLCKNLQRSSQM